MTTAPKNDQISVSNNAVLANITLFINTGKGIICEINKTRENLDVSKCLNTRVIKKVKGRSYDWYKEVRESLQEIYPDNYFLNQFDNICTTQWALDLDTFKKLRASQIKTIRENNCYVTARNKINSTDFHHEWESHKRGMLNGMQSAVESGLNFLEDRKTYINIYGINDELLALEPVFNKMVNKISSVFPECAIDEYSEAKLADSDDNWRDIFDKIIDEGKDSESAMTENKEELLIKPKRKIMKICPSNLGNDDYERVCNNIEKYKFWFEREFVKRTSTTLLTFLPEWNDPIPKYDHNDSDKSFEKLNSYRVDLLFWVDDLKNRIVQKIQEAESVKAETIFTKAEKPDFHTGIYIPRDPSLKKLNKFIARFFDCLDASIWVEVREEERNERREKTLKSGDIIPEHIIDENLDQYFLKTGKPRFRQNDEFLLTPKRFNEIKTHINQNIIDLYSYINAEMPEYNGLFEQIQRLAPQLLDKPSTEIHHLHPIEGACDKKTKENLALCVDHYISGIEKILRLYAKKNNGVKSSLNDNQHPLSVEQIRPAQHINITENRTITNIMNISSSPEARDQLAIENKDEPEKKEPKAKEYLSGKAKSWDEIHWKIQENPEFIEIIIKKQRIGNSIEGKKVNEFRYTDIGFQSGRKTETLGRHYKYFLEFVISKQSDRSKSEAKPSQTGLAKKSQKTFDSDTRAYGDGDNKPLIQHNQREIKSTQRVYKHKINEILKKCFGLSEYPITESNRLLFTVDLYKEPIGKIIDFPPK